MNGKILIVEDDPAIQQQLQTILADYEAVETTPDVILLGLSSGGFEALARVQEEWPEVPVVVLTAWADHALVTKLLDRGAASAAAKPLDSEELRAAVAYAVNGDGDIDDSRGVVVAELDPDLPEAVLAAAGRRLARLAPVERRDHSTFVVATDRADAVHQALTERPVDAISACRRVTATVSVYEPAVALAA